MASSGRSSADGSIWKAFGVLSLAAAAFIVWFIRSERCIYFWDFNTFWQKSIELTDLFRSDPLFFPRQVYRSLHQDIYNDLPSAVPAMLGSVWGTTRLPYLLSNFGLYFLPVSAGFCLVRLSVPEDARRFPAEACVTILFSVFMWEPLLYGYPDVGGLILVQVILWMYLRRGWEGLSARQAAGIALLLMAMVIFRRWYIYWALSFLGVSASFALFMAPRDRKIPSLIRCTLSGTAAVFLYLAVTWPLPKVMFSAAHLDHFSAYRFSQGPLDALGRSLRNFGVLWTGFWVAGAVSAIRDERTRRQALFTFSQMAVIYMLFIRSQDFDPHHYYLLLPGMILFQVDLMRRLRAVGRILLALSSIGLFMLVFIGPLHPVADRLGILAPGIRHAPMVRDDLGEIKRMISDLRSWTGPGDRIYVAASSDVMNSDILKTAEAMLGFDKVLAPRILWTESIDRLSGAPESFFTAEYVVVADPIQYHVAVDEQRVVTLAARPLLTGEGIGTCYEKLPAHYTLKEGVNAYVYRRTRELPADLVQAIREGVRHAEGSGTSS